MARSANPPTQVMSFPSDQRLIRTFPICISTRKIRFHGIDWKRLNGRIFRSYPFRMVSSGDLSKRWPLLAKLFGITWKLSGFNFPFLEFLILISPRLIYTLEKHALRSLSAFCQTTSGLVSVFINVFSLSRECLMRSNASSSSTPANNISNGTMSSPEPKAFQLREIRKRRVRD